MKMSSVLSKTLIKSGQTHPPSICPLSDIDLVMPHVFAQAYWVYPGQSLNRETMIEALKMALKQMPELSGELCIGRTGEMAVVCNDSGVAWADCKRKLDLVLCGKEWGEFRGVIDLNYFSCSHGRNGRLDPDR